MADTRVNMNGLQDSNKCECPFDILPWCMSCHTMHTVLLPSISRNAHVHEGKGAICRLCKRIQGREGRTAFVSMHYIVLQADCSFTFPQLYTFHPLPSLFLLSLSLSFSFCTSTCCLNPGEMVKQTKKQMK